MNPADFTDKLPGRLVTVEDGWAFIPDPPPRNIGMNDATIDALVDATTAVNSLGFAASFMSDLNPALLFRPFVRREAVCSLRIEGTQTTLFDLFAYEVREAEQRIDPSSDDARLVAGYVKALNYGMANLGGRPIGWGFIQKLHEYLMYGSGETGRVGEFRKEQVFVGGRRDTIRTARYVPPPSPQMRECMSDFECFVNEDVPLRPLIRSAVAHYQFEAIHPFGDGNGRVGRMLIPLLLCQWGAFEKPQLYISAYFERYRSEYYDLLLRVSTHGDWDAWILFFLRGVAVETTEISSRIQRFSVLRAEMLDRVRRPRASALLGKAIDLLFASPVQSVGSFQRGLNMKTFQSASRLVNNLVEAGILEEVTGRKYGRLFASREILTIQDATHVDL